MLNKQFHPFHLVDPSPWPIITAWSAFFTTFNLVLYMHGYETCFSHTKFFLEMLIISMGFWWSDMIREGTYEGQHTLAVQTGLKLGVILFIVSEIMFFFAFFWAFFHSSFNPSPILGGVWPPAFLTVLNAWEIPLLNTILLLSSGASMTWVHHSIILGDQEQAMEGLAVTISLAIIFTALQGFEYVTAPFSISDSVYGSTFYMATGFHGFHVLVGTIFLFVCFCRLCAKHFTVQHHFGFEAAAWYWHFVDVVWLFLFITIYWWGGY